MILQRLARPLAGLVLAALVMPALAASAEPTPSAPIPEFLRASTPAPEVDARAWVLMDFQTGWILAEGNPDQRIEPASLTKLMTAYLVFSALDNGSISLDDEVHVSEKAWRTGGSRTFVRVGTRVPVETLVKGMIVQSGNDASVALAEHVAGTEENFAHLMNETAAELGMQNTHFVNSMGLPAENHYSTARDLTILTRAIISKYPQYYRWYSLKEFTYNDITQYSRNKLLWRDETIDGVKTGYTKAAGYCLIGSSKKDGMRLIATVVGAEKPSIRLREVQALLKYGMSAYESRLVASPDRPVTEVAVYMGTVDQVAVAPGEPLYVTIPRGGDGKLANEVDVEVSVNAPVSAGQELGALSISYDGNPLGEQPLVALGEVPEGSLWKRTVDTVRLWFD